jgi:argininosuccinate lyase
MAGIIGSVTFEVDAMREAAQGGFMAATDLADYLVGKGLAFRDAHEVVGKLVLSCEKHGKKLQELTVDELKRAHERFESDAIAAIDLDEMVRRRTRCSDDSDRE